MNSQIYFDHELRVNLPLILYFYLRYILSLLMIYIYGVLYYKSERSKSGPYNYIWMVKI